MVPDFEYYKDVFIEQATNLGHTEQHINKCLDYAEVLINNKVPVIYNVTHLSRLTNFKKNYVVQAAIVSKFSDAYYRYYNIPKKNGGYRKIKEPLPNLKNIQHWILKNILYQIPVSRYAKAYIRKHGIKDNLKFHKGQQLVLSLDIMDFFTSIGYDKVFEVFRSVGYSTNVSRYLAKLCCLDDCLPQGAPTSPYLSNLIFRALDEEIGEYCLNNEIRYTRYADDMTFSGDFNHNDLINFLAPILENTGFSINEEKTNIMFSYDRQLITGVLVNNKIQLPKNKRRKLRQEIFYIDEYGLDSHLERIGAQKNIYLNRLMGQIGFGLYLNPKDSKLKEYKKLIGTLMKENN